MLPSKILIIDDQASIRLMLTELFAEPNRKIYEAASGEQALQILEQITPEIILLDLSLPGMSGFEFIQLCNQNNTPSKIITMTGHDDEKLANRSLSLGSIANFTKPFDIYSLYSLVVHILKKDKEEILSQSLS